MITNTRHSFRRKLLCRLALLASVSLLGACGGGGGNPLAQLYTSLSISDLTYPADEGTNDDIKIEARASSIGEISGGDIDWSLEQTSGDDVSVVSKDLSDNNYKVTFNVKAPGETGTVGLKIKVKANGYSDSRSFFIDIK